MSCQVLPCPGPEPLKICVLRGVGSDPIVLQYVRDDVKAFAALASPGPWTATAKVYNPDGTTFLTITSPARITLASAGYNVQYQFTAADFTLGTIGAEYTHDCVVTPTVGVPLVVLRGPLEYLATADCSC